MSLPSAEVIIKAVRDLGFPIVVGLTLLWVIVSGLPSDIKSALDHVAAARQEIADHRHETGELLKVMQRICVNTAPTEQMREACIP